MNKVYPLLAFAMLANAAYAQDQVPQTEVKWSDQPVKGFNIGAGFTKKLIHLNAEWVNDYGIAYAKGGVFLDDDKTPGAQVGFRHPVHLTGKEKNGYYVGVYAGHLDTKDKDGDREARLGAGLDLSYVMLSKERISTFSVGLGVAEKLEDREGRTIADTEPQLQFSYTLSVGL